MRLLASDLDRNCVNDDAKTVDALQPLCDWSQKQFARSVITLPISVLHFNCNCNTCFVANSSQTRHKLPQNNPNQCENVRSPHQSSQRILTRLVIYSSTCKLVQTRLVIYSSTCKLGQAQVPATKLTIQLIDDVDVILEWKIRKQSKSTLQ